MEIYERLDQLQTTIFANLDSLVRTLDLKDEEYTTASDSILTQINHNLSTYKDYLRILKLEKGYKSSLSIPTRSTLQIYELKYESLKKKLRDLLIFMNDSQQYKVHKDRLLKFNLLVPQASKSGGSAASTNNLSARDQLFANRSTSRSNESTGGIAQQINSQNSKITASLQASRNLLSATILQSELNIDTIDQQSKDLLRLNENFTKFGDLLNKSRGIIKFIEKQDKADRQRIYLSMGFFLLCCCWVIYRRVLRRPIGLLFWSLFKIFNIFGWLFGSGGSREKVDEEFIEEIVTDVSLSVPLVAMLASTLDSSVEEITTLLHSVITSTTASAERLVDEL
ncbi:SEC20 [Candida oxycetoniae]|uniref:SEC20 n=1 Tax=Candida oxycetoniae TaxID=497107 RepID=A0AAI9STB4_9ASCO|nr:SEC20 [Candida oxycetoniae]KAI3402469.2 SEC20 [Candida oxycetoniae]